MAKVESTPLAWSPDHSLPTNSSAIDQASSMIQTTDGRIWVVWEKEVLQGHAIYYSTSSDYGLTWTSGENLTNVPNYDINTDPSIIQLSNGTLVVVWSSLKSPPTPPPLADFRLDVIPSTLSIPAGSSGNSTIMVTSLEAFTDPVKLSCFVFDNDGNVTTNLIPSQVTPPPDGNANSTLVVTISPGAPLQDYWIQVKGRGPPPLNLTHAKVVTVTVTSALASSPEPSSPAQASDPILSDQTNNNYTLYYKTSNDLGATWSKENFLPLTDTNGHNLSPSIIQAANGTIWLAWTSTRVNPSNTEIFYKTSSNGITWSNDVQLTYNASTDARPAIARMQDGRIWVAWHSNRYDPYQEIVYKTYNGTAWSTDRRLTNNALEDTSPVVHQSQDGIIRVFWSSCDMNLGSTHDIYYVESTNNGESWTTPILFPTDSPEDMYPSVMQSIDSRIWVARTTNKTGNWDIFFKTSLVHNVAVQRIVPSQVQVYQQEIVNVNVTIENQGDYNETAIVVRLYANTTPVGSRTIALNARDSAVVTFAWDTAGFVRGNYTMKAKTDTVAGEVYIGDNTRTEGDVVVKLLGDVDDNRLVEVRDLRALGKAYSSTPGSPNWNEEADFNGDNAVGGSDLSLLSGNYGKTG